MGFPVDEVTCRRDLEEAGTNTIFVAGILVVLSSSILLIVNILLYTFTKKRIRAQTENVVEQMHLVMDSVLVCMLPKSLMGKLRGDNVDKKSESKSEDNNKTSK